MKQKQFEGNCMSHTGLNLRLAPNDYSKNNKEIRKSYCKIRRKNQTNEYVCNYMLEKFAHFLLITYCKNYG